MVFVQAFENDEGFVRGSLERICNCNQRIEIFLLYLRKNISDTLYCIRVVKLLNSLIQLGLHFGWNLDHLEYAESLLIDQRSHIHVVKASRAIGR
jgi:hypothetical protein